MLRLHDVAPGARRALSITFEPGTISTIVGPNGSGKSALLRAVAGLERYRGRVELDGVHLDGLSPEKRAAAGIAYVPDGRRLFGRLTVSENLRVGATTVRGHRAARDAVARVMDAFPLLRDRADQRANTLSGGEAQLLVIARALVARPKVLLVDEPFQGLSVEARSLVRAVLAGAQRDRTTVVLTSPEPIEATATIPIFAHEGVPA